MARGDDVSVDVGGVLDPRFPETVTIRGTVERVVPDGPFGRTIVVRMGRSAVVMTDRAPLVIQPSFYKALGLSLWDADVVVVKNFFPFLLYFLPYARKYMYVKTRGLTDWDAAYGLDFAGPVHPRDRVDDWHEADRRRRAT